MLKRKVESEFLLLRRFFVFVLFFLSSSSPTSQTSECVTLPRFSIQSLFCQRQTKKRTHSRPTQSCVRVSRRVVEKGDVSEQAKRRREETKQRKKGLLAATFYRLVPPLPDPHIASLTTILLPRQMHMNWFMEPRTLLLLLLECSKLLSCSTVANKSGNLRRRYHHHQTKLNKHVEF